MQDSDKKRCNRCNLVKPITAFYRAKNNLDGRENSCIDCRNGRTPSEPIKTSEKEKFCKICRTWKPFEIFKKDKRSFDGYSKTCLDCFLKNIKKTPVEQKKDTTPPGLYHALPLVTGKTNVVECPLCSREIVTAIRLPTRPVGRYVVECPHCCAALLMGLV